MSGLNHNGLLDAPSHLYKRLCPSVRLSRVIFRRVLGASCAVYPALFHSGEGFKDPHMITFKDFIIERCHKTAKDIKWSSKKQARVNEMQRQVSKS